MRVERSNRYRNAGLQSQLPGPGSRKQAGDLIRSRIFTLEFFSDPRKQGINFDKELLGRQAAKFRVPQPLMTHRANAALHFSRIADSAKRGRRHIAMLESGIKLAMFL